MSKVKYRYNTHTLDYERIEPSFRDRLTSFLTVMGISTVISAIAFFTAYQYIDSIKVMKLKRENTYLSSQVEIIEDKMNLISNVLDALEERDDNIYRAIFEAEPIDQDIRQAGIGGINRYERLEGYNNSDLVVEAQKKLDKISKRMYIQSYSFDEIEDLSNKKVDMLSAIPAIQPISNNDLTRVASGFGYRIHPIYKTRKMHEGMDFTAKTGTEIYATGNGKVVDVRRSEGRKGYGNYVVVDHGYGYQTLYGHMSRFNVRAGQEVKRGQVIGYVGNTGGSTGPHLHYEVIKDDKKIDPVNYYYNDLTPEEFDRMIQISSRPTQSFD